MENSNELRCLICEESVGVGALQSHIFSIHIGPFRYIHRCSVCQFTSLSETVINQHSISQGHLFSQVVTESRSYVENLAKKILDDCLLQGKQQRSKEPPETSTASDSHGEESSSVSVVKVEPQKSKQPEEAVSRRRCAFCQDLVKNKTVDFYAHISEKHYHKRLSCPFCPTTKRTTVLLENHVKVSHPGRSFSVLAVKEKAELMAKMVRCFPKKGIARKKKVPKSPQVQVAIEKITEPTPCELCGEVVQDKKKHVTSVHLKSDEQGITPLAEFQKTRECFPEDAPNSCAICTKVVSTVHGKRMHAALRHLQIPLQCPVCQQQEYHPDRISRHAKLVHPTAAVKFSPGASWMRRVSDMTKSCFPKRQQPVPRVSVTATPTTSTDDGALPVVLAASSELKVSPALPEVEDEVIIIKEIPPKKQKRPCDPFEEPELSNWLCRLCNRSFVHSLVEEHVWLVHMKQLPYLCGRCHWRGFRMETALGHSPQCAQQDIVVSNDVHIFYQFQVKYSQCFPTG